MPIQKISPYVVDGLANICERGLSKDPKKRFFDAQKMALAIEEILENVGLKIDINQLAQILKSPPESLNNFKSEVLLKTKEKIAFYEQRGQKIKVLSLRHRLEHTLKRPKTKTIPYFWLATTLLGLIIMMGGFFLKYSFTNKTSMLVEAPILLKEQHEMVVEKIPDEVIVEEKPTIIIKDAITNISIWPFARVYVDDHKVADKAKYLTLSLPMGKHKLKFEHPYAQEKEISIFVSPNNNPSEINIALEKTKPAKLIINSNIDAEIAIDNIYKGNTSDSIKKPIIIPLPDKTSHIKKDILVSRVGFKSFFQNIEFIAGTTKLLDLILYPIDNP
jgi:hypothetical protein